MQFVSRDTRVGNRGGRPESVLLIDRDDQARELLRQWLEREGLSLKVTHNAVEGLDRALSSDHAIVILDIMLPGFNGFELLRRMRATSQIPVVITTARAEEVDRIVALEVGADDYISKPFNPRELVARLRAVLRRVQFGISRGASPSHRFSAEDIEVDTSARTVFRAGESVDLTTTEFDFLQLLLRNAGRVVRREELAQAVLGRPFSPLDRSIDLHVSHLRRKLGHHLGGSQRIKAIRGVGYLYALQMQGRYHEPKALANNPRAFA
jgi:two-component system, OmpR family, response regulator CpxR